MKVGYGIWNVADDTSIGAVRENNPVHRRIVDIYLGGFLALCICIDCGEVWWEGDENAGVGVGCDAD